MRRASTCRHGPCLVQHQGLARGGLRMAVVLVDGESQRRKVSKLEFPSWQDVAASSELSGLPGRADAKEEKELGYQT